MNNQLNPNNDLPFMNGMPMQPLPQQMLVPVDLGLMCLKIYETQTRVDQLGAELCQKKTNENTILPDQLCPSSDGKCYNFISGLKKHIYVTNFTVSSFGQIKKPKSIEGNDCYAIHVVTVDNMKRQIVISREDFFKDSCLSRALMTHGCFYSKFGNRVAEKRFLAVLRNFLLARISDNVHEILMSGWNQVEGRYVYSDFVYQNEIYENFGLCQKVFETVKKPNVRRIVDMQKVFKSMEHYFILISWLIYTIIEGYITPTLRLGRMLVLKGDLSLCHELALFSLKLFNRNVSACDITLHDSDDKIIKILSQARDETVIISDMKKSNTRNMQNNLNKRYNEFTDMFCNRNHVYSGVQISATATIISNNISREIDVQNLIIVHVDETVIDEDSLTVCRLKSDPFIDLISIVLNYLSLVLDSVSEDITAHYLNRVTDPDLNDTFISAGTKKCFIVFEYVLRLFMEAVKSYSNDIEFSDAIINSIIKDFFIKQEERNSDVEESDNTDALESVRMALSKLLNSGLCNIVENNMDDNENPEKTTIFYDRDLIYMKEETFKKELCQMLEKNMSGLQVLRVLDSNGYLVTNNGTGHTRKTTINGERKHYIAIKRLFIDRIGEISIFN